MASRTSTTPRLPGGGSSTFASSRPPTTTLRGIPNWEISTACQGRSASGPPAPDALGPLPSYLMEPRERPASGGQGNKPFLYFPAAGSGYRIRKQSKEVNSEKGFQRVKRVRSQRTEIFPATRSVPPPTTSPLRKDGGASAKSAACR